MNLEPCDAGNVWHSSTSSFATNPRFSSRASVRQRDARQEFSRSLSVVLGSQFMASRSNDRAALLSMSSTFLTTARSQRRTCFCCSLSIFAPFFILVCMVSTVSAARSPAEPFSFWVIPFRGNGGSRVVVNSNCAVQGKYPAFQGDSLVESGRYYAAVYQRAFA